MFPNVKECFRIYAMILATREMHVGDIKYLTGMGMDDVISYLNLLGSYGYLEVKGTHVLVSELGLKLTQGVLRGKGLWWILARGGDDFSEYGFVKVKGDYQITPLNRFLLDKVDYVGIVQGAFFSNFWRRKILLKTPFKYVEDILRYASRMGRVKDRTRLVMLLSRIRNRLLDLQYALTDTIEYDRRKLRRELCEHIPQCKSLWYRAPIEDLDRLVIMVDGILSDVMELLWRKTGIRFEDLYRHLRGLSYTHCIVRYENVSEWVPPGPLRVACIKDNELIVKPYGYRSIRELKRYGNVVFKIYPSSTLKSVLLRKRRRTLATLRKVRKILHDTPEGDILTLRRIILWLLSLPYVSFDSRRVLSLIRNPTKRLVYNFIVEVERRIKCEQ